METHTRSDVELSEFPPPSYRTALSAQEVFSPSAALPEAPPHPPSILKPAPAHLPNRRNSPPIQPTYPTSTRPLCPKTNIPAIRRLLFYALLCNTPLCLFLLLDIVGTNHPRTRLYHRILYPTTRGTNAFYIFSVALAFCTALANLNFFSRFFKHEIRPDYQTLGSRLRRKLLLVLVFVLAVGGPVAWPFASYRVHRSILPVLPSCVERGFASSVLIQVPDSRSAFPHSDTAAYIADSGGARFTLVLHAPGDGGLDTFVVTPRVGSVEPGSLDGVMRDYTMVFDLLSHSYVFNSTSSSVKYGMFTERPLTFPSLVMPLNSTGKGTIGNPPEVEMVDVGREGKTWVKTVQREWGEEECTMLRMCVRWTVEEMVRNVGVLESVLAVVGRVGIEMVRFGRSC